VPVMRKNAFLSPYLCDLTCVLKLEPTVHMAVAASMARPGIA
jgi:hypothetical protein